MVSPWHFKSPYVSWRYLLILSGAYTGRSFAFLAFVVGEWGIEGMHLAYALAGMLYFCGIALVFAIGGYKWKALIFRVMEVLRVHLP